MNTAIAEDYDYSQSGYTPSASTSRVEIFNSNNLPQYSPGNMSYNPSMNLVNPVSNMSYGSPSLNSNLVITGASYASPGLPASYNMPAGMNLSNLPNPQSSSLNNYANALNNAVNNYNVALSNYLNSYNNAVANLSVSPSVIYNNIAPVNSAPAYYPEVNDMQRAKTMYNNVMSDVNNNSFIKDAQRYGLSVEKSGGYGLDSMTNSPVAYAQVDIFSYNPVINSAAKAIGSGYKDVLITGDGVLTANPIGIGQTRSIIIDSNNPTFIGKDNLYSMYRSTPELTQDMAIHNYNVAKENNLATYSSVMNNIDVNIPKVPLVQQENVQSVQ